MLKLWVLGAISLHQADGHPVQSVLAQPKRLAVLTYLAICDGFCRRDSILPLFWPELDQEHGRAALRKIVHYLRGSLGADVIISRGDDEVAIGENRIWCDVVEFRRATQKGDAQAALDFYRGELLPGFHLEGVPDFERWLEGERSRLRHEATEQAAKLAEAAASSGDLQSAVRWKQRQFALTPDDEVALRSLLELLRRLGDHAGAMRSYEDFRHHLSQTYGIQPSLETRRLAASLRAPEAESLAIEAGPTSLVLEAIPTSGASTEPRTPSAATVETAGAGPPLPKSARPWIYRSLVIGALAILVAVGGLVFRMGVGNGSNAAVTSAQTSVAVLPIADLSAGGRAAYLADGLTDELINSLGRAASLRVTSRTSAYALKGTQADIRDIGKRLGVDYVLEGSLRTDGSRIRLSLQLVSVSDGQQRWSQSYDRQMADVFAMEEEIGREVAVAIQGPMALHMAPRAEWATEDAAAHDDYLRGRYLLRGGLGTGRERVEQAIRYFEAATQKDPGYSLAYAGLADAYLTLAEYDSPTTALPRAKSAAMQALRLDDELAEPHLALAKVRLHYDWDWKGAEHEYLRALELAPELPEAHYGYADFLKASGRVAPMLEQVRIGLQLERRQVVDTMAFAAAEQTRLAAALLDSRRPTEATAHARRALEMDPTILNARRVLALSYAMEAHPDSALLEMEEIRRLAGDRLPYFSQLGVAYARAGRRSKALAVLDDLRERARSEYVSKDQIGEVYLALGDEDEALRWYEGAIRDHHWWMIYRAKGFAGSPDPRFRRLAELMNTPE